MKSTLLSLWFDPIGIELKSTISVENALSTRPLIDWYVCATFFYTFRNQNDFHCLPAPQISNIFATFRYFNFENLKFENFENTLILFRTTGLSSLYKLLYITVYIT